MIGFTAPRGGACCSVVAAAVAAHTARHHPTVVVDMGGDQATIMGASQPEPDLGEWLASASPSPDALFRLATPITDRLRLLAMPGSHSASDNHSAPPPERMELLAALLAHWPDQVIVDIGTHWSTAAPLLSAASTTVLVSRACYLSLRSSVHRPRVDAAVIVREPGRALRRRDCEAALGVPVVAEVDWDPLVARGVDAGILIRRMPRSLRPLEALVPRLDVR